jgi:exopolyphosphatase/guanosine-5'-triphosphate,3'-diphosphate pyrophosphatase
MRKAVLDVGSNSVLLAVGEKTPEGWRTVCDESRVTGLGEGVRATGLLSESGMRRTLAAIETFFEKAHELGAPEVRAWATMAARIAENRDEFLFRCAGQGTPVALLSGEEEAEMGFLAVAHDPLFEPLQGVAIIDPGGNSTELVLARHEGQDWSVEYRHSFPVGTLGLRDGALAGDAPGPDALLLGARTLDELLRVEHLPPRTGPAVVLGASGTNLVSLKLRMEQWDAEVVHGQALSFEEVSRAAGWLSALGDAGRASLVGIEPGRERTIHIGALILERFLAAIHADEAIVSVRGWRHEALRAWLCEPAR